MTTFPLLFDAIRHGSDDSGSASVRRTADESSDTGSQVSEQDCALIEQVRASEIKAFDRIFEKYWAPLWRFANSELHASEHAEDVVQDVFARLWSRRASWAPSHSIQAYLYGAVRHAIIDRRRHDRLVQAHAELTVFEAAGSRNEAADLAERGELLEKLNIALARLPEDRRQAVVLRYEHGLSYPALARVMGVSVAAAEKQVARAVTALRAWLEVSAP